MISIIWSIAVCFIVYRLVVNRNNSGGGSKAGGPPVIHTTPAGQREQRKAGPVNGWPNRPAAGQMGHAAPPQNRPAGQPPEEREISTMEYLEEKARQDAAEHARDKWEENKRLNRNYGGLRVAERLSAGDTAPDGKKCVICDYCGAENLIPMLPRERFGCYFCREPLR